VFLLVRLGMCRPLPSRLLRIRSDLTTLGLVRHPVGLATPDRAATLGAALDATRWPTTVRSRGDGALASSFGVG
jgi:hypothetical protein